MSDAAATSLTIQSHTGPYRAMFDDDALARLNGDVPTEAHFIVDARVAELYADAMENVLSAPSVLLLEASEDTKTLDRFPAYVEHLVSRGVRRNHMLVAIGGGIIQDTTCFLAATLLRGIEWRFYPTTLLAQADSCIGSKSSINAGAAKNILGTFTPPREVFISTRFLDTLDERDVRSGIGEMLKVHAIEGPAAFDAIAADYERILTDRSVTMRYIRQSLEIKLPYIEEDEFDRARRNIFNYGHTFGHAIEAATKFAVPHGLAVTMGMDLANFAAARLGHADDRTFERMHPVLRRNYAGFEAVKVPLDPFVAALGKDKKNVGTDLVAILPDSDGRLSKVRCALDAPFREICGRFFDSARAA